MATFEGEGRQWIDGGYGDIATRSTERWLGVEGTVGASRSQEHFESSNPAKIMALVVSGDAGRVTATRLLTIHEVRCQEPRGIRDTSRAALF
jgi:hypothetical protein